MKHMLLFTALALGLSGCAILGTGARSGSGSERWADVPQAPAEQAISDRGQVPDLPASTHIVVGVCKETGAYAAMGVDTQASKFTFLISGGEPTRQQAFQKFEAAGVPVTLYTVTTELVPDKDGKTYVFNPCLSLTSGATRAVSAAATGPIAQAGDDPPPSPKPTGGGFSNGQVFAILSWRTALSLNDVSHPAATPGGASTF